MKMKKILLLTFTLLLLVSCGGKSSAAPENVTPEMLKEANRVSKLTDAYGTVVITSEEMPDAFSFCWFREGELLVKYAVIPESDSIVTVQGSILKDGLYFTYSEWEGTPAASAMITKEPLPYAEDELLSELFGGEITFLESADGVSVYRVSGDSERICRVDAENLRLLSCRDNDDSISLSYGGTHPGGEFLSAWDETRTIKYHVSGSEQYNLKFDYPKGWQFLPLFEEEAEYYTDPDMTEPTDRLVPADGQNHEIWVTAGET